MVLAAADGEEGRDALVGGCEALADAGDEERRECLAVAGGEARREVLTGAGGEY